jgi:hypothetical protein
MYLRNVPSQEPSVNESFLCHLGAIMVSFGDHGAFDENFSTLPGSNIFSVVIDKSKSSQLTSKYKKWSED